MKKNLKHLLTGCILLSLVMNLIACGSNNNSETIVNGSTSISDEFVKLSKGKTQGKNSSDSKADKNAPPTVLTDLEPSDGLEFESNGDGTCTLVGIGICKDTDIVIPVESPDGETVTLIGEYALYDLEDVDSVTFVNYNYEIDEYAFFGCEDLESVTICKNSKSDNKINIDDRAFQYCDKLKTVTVGKGNIEIGKYVFTGCDDNLKITIAGKNYNEKMIQDGLK